MNVHIILEDVSIDTNNKKKCLLNILNQYPLFKETSIKEANYLIIIPNYPSAGKQYFSDKLKDIIFYEATHIQEKNTFLLDSDNTLFTLDEDRLDCVYRNIVFKEDNLSIKDVFGFTPQQLSDYASKQEFINWQTPPQEIKQEPIKEKPKKRRLFLG